MNKLSSIILFFTLILFAACQQNVPPASQTDTANDKTQKFNVAVVLPLSSEDGQSSRFHRIADLYLSTLRSAIQECGFSTPFTLNLEWFDEGKIDLDSTASTLASRNDLLAVVGPLYSDNVKIFAEQCFKTKKPLIAPCASSESVIRAFAINSAFDEKADPFLWALTETDISQAEALLAKAKSYGGKKVSLLSSSDSYGKTFFTWTPFIAQELGLTMIKNVRYTSANTGTNYEAGTPAVSLESAAAEALSGGADYVICALASYKDAEAVLNEREKLGSNAPKLLFTGTSFTDDFLRFGNKAEGVEGTAPYADPTSGFAVDYYSRFNENPMFGEAHLYDSLLLCGFAAARCLQNKTSGSEKFSNKSVNAAMKVFSGSGKTGQPSWNKFGMMLMLNQINNEERKINGATGPLDFDKETLTSALRTVYVHWLVADGSFVNLDFTSKNGSGRVADNRASWEWNVVLDEEIVKKSEHASIEYPELQSRWAVIVAGSKGWGNYRHQADALFMYRLLKRNNYDDDHIILIVADDIAGNVRNKKPGQVIARLNGDNLYTEDIQIDYLLSELTSGDIMKIMKGESLNLPERSLPNSTHPYLVQTPTILNTDTHADVLWFWSGHGMSGQLIWHGIDEHTGFSTDNMEETLSAMKTQNRFRKMLVVIEACYSGSLFNFETDIDGVLVFTAASAFETSLADEYSVELKVWLSNRFTRNFTDCLTARTNDYYYYVDLYKYLVQNTIGSHVQLLNSECFGNLYVTSPSEFF